MITFRRIPSGARRAARGLLATLALVAAPAAAQAPVAPELLVYRPLADREALEQVVSQLSQARTANGNGSAALMYAQSRLRDGDFRPGDLVLIEVQGDTTLTDTFTVASDRTLMLPSPAVGTLSLKGVLRTELQEQVSGFIGKFVRNAVVRARPLLRVGVQGELVKPGYYYIPADAVLADALMAAGGTRPEANMKTLRIERDGKPIIRGNDLHRLIAQGLTLDQANLRGGEVIAVDRKPNSSWTEGLRLVSIVVSIAGGLYGLSRAF
jgi:protein involved in polysaccharide export with SLBB domain